MPLILDGTEGITQPTITTAFGLPAGTTAQRPASPEAGMVRFNTDTGLLETYTGTEWSAGVDVEQAIADFAAGEPGQPRLVGNAVSLFPGTYPVLTVTASDAHSVANGLGTTLSSGPSNPSVLTDSVIHVINKYTGSINFRATILFQTASGAFSNWTADIQKNGVTVQTFSGSNDVNTVASLGPVAVSIVPGDTVKWRLRKNSGEPVTRMVDGNNTASNGYITRSLFAPAV